MLPLYGYLQGLGCFEEGDRLHLEFTELLVSVVGDLDPCGIELLRFDEYRCLHLSKGSVYVGASAVIPGLADVRWYRLAP
ncbi:MAG: hypothetical protein PUH41_02295 [Prevotella sp.]|nr:hypothetical protein [Prevotella sp.]